MNPVWETHVQEVPYTVLEAGLGDSDETGALHRVPSSLGDAHEGSTVHGASTRLGNPHQGRLLPRHDPRLRNAGTGGVLHGVETGQVPQDGQSLFRPLGTRAVAPRAAALSSAVLPRQCRNGCGCRRCREADRVHPLGARDVREEGPLHRLQDGAGDPREDLHLPGLPHGGNLREDPPTVCKMVPEQRVVGPTRCARWCPSNA